MTFITDEIISEGGMTGSSMTSTILTPLTILHSDASDTIQSLSTTTYPDLTELSYVKGVTSSIQTQLGNKVDNTRSISTTAPLSGGGDLTADRTLSITQSNTSTNGYLSSTDWNTFNNKIRSLYNVAAGNQAVTGNLEQYITGSNVTANSIKAGTIVTWNISCSKTNAGTAQPAWRLKFGTNSSTADATVITFTGVAQTGAVDTAFITIQCLFRTIGTNAAISGHYNLTHNLASTGFANVPANNVFGANVSFNTTAANSFVGISVNPGASAIWTVNQVTVRMENIN